MAIRTCPRCARLLRLTEPACASCGFSLAEADARFGSFRVKLPRLVDAVGAFGAAERDRYGAAVEAFEARFPQLMWATYIAELPGDVNLRELGFWMVNRAVVQSTDRANDRIIMLCINHATRGASITLGYFPEQHLAEEDLAATLEACRQPLASRRFAEFACACVDHLSSRLRRGTALA